MNNIPLFTSEFGVASLTLEKIPYTGQAYVVIHDGVQLRELVQECIDFCRAAGAKTVYASGTAFLETYPLHTEVIALSRSVEGVPSTDAQLVPVDRETLSTWRDIYNERMREVPGAAFLRIRDSEELLREGNCYFVHRDDAPLGIGVVGEGMIKAIASVTPGGGKDTLLALCSTLRTDTVSLEVASNNIPAMKLYQSLGFEKTGTISKWYEIF